MRGVLALAALLAVVLTGCSAVTPPDSGPQRVDTDVDTPELRQMKRAAKVETCTPGSAGRVDDGMPEITLPCLGGGKDVDVSGLRGPMVINLWASWCPPCRRELPIYQQFHEKYGDRVQVLGIDYNDQMPEAAMELVRDAGVTYPQLADPDSDLAYAGPLPNFPGLPAIIFVNEDGTVVDDDGDRMIMFEEIDSLGELERLVQQKLDVKL